MSTVYAICYPPQTCVKSDYNLQHVHIQTVISALVKEVVKVTYFPDLTTDSLAFTLERSLVLFGLLPSAFTSDNLLLPLCKGFS